MPDRVISWSRITAWIRIPILIGVVVIMVWQLWRFLPVLVENRIQSRLMESGIVASDFPVREVGLNGLSVGPGTLLLETNSLQWQTLDVRYRLQDLMSGRVEEILLEEPVLSYYLPSPQVLAPEEPLSGLLSAGEDEQTGAAGTPATSPGLESTGAGTEPEEAPAETAVPEPPSSAAAPALPTLREQLLGLPLNVATATLGRVEILLEEDVFVEWALNGQLKCQPFGTTGDLVLDNDWMTAEVSLRVPANQPVIILQADAVMPPDALKTIEGKLLRLFPTMESMPQVVSSGAFTTDLLLDIPSVGTPRGSGEASVEELVLRFPFLEADLVLDRFLVAGVLQDGLLSLQGGAEVLPLKIADFNSRTFRMRFSLHPEGLLDLETEAISWTLGNISGTGALRGRNLFLAGAADPAARLEASLTEVVWQELRIDPFSLLAESNGRNIQIKASPMGLVHDGTLWVEDLSVDWDINAQTGRASMAWFNLAGKPMGTIEADLDQSGTDQSRTGYRLINSAGETFLEGILEEGGDRMALEASGVVSSDWINALNKWWKVLPLALRGRGPEIDLRLGGLFPFLHGSVDLDLEGLGLELESGLSMEGMGGDVRLAVSTLPRTDGPQDTTIDRIRSGDLVLEDVSLKWDMPHLRHLEVQELRGRLAEGRLRTEPFTVDPMNPRFQTRLHFESVDGNLLLELLGEDRFTIRGDVSGWMDVGWEDDALVIGKGNLAMDASGGANRFIFSDKTFLREKFAAFAGVPAELRDRFLEALLQEGIVIENLVADLGPSREGDMILLRISVSGESRTDRLQVPIKELVINNLISPEDLAHLMGIFGTLKIQAQP